MKKILALLVIAPMLISCSGSKKDQFNEAYVKDTNGFDILMGQFAHNIENIWGMNEVLIAGPKDYVKYSDQYYTRSHINFDAGTITLETISGTDPGNPALIGLRDRLANVYLDQADRHVERGRREEALRALDAARQLSPTNPRSAALEAKIEGLPAGS